MVSEGLTAVSCLSQVESLERVPFRRFRSLLWLEYEGRRLEVGTILATILTAPLVTTVGVQEEVARAVGTVVGTVVGSEVVGMEVVGTVAVGLELRPLTSVQ